MALAIPFFWGITKLMVEVAEDFQEPVIFNYANFKYYKSLQIKDFYVSK